MSSQKINGFGISIKTTYLKLKYILNVYVHCIDYTVRLYV